MPLNWTNSIVKIAIATKYDWTKVSGHAGQTRDWLVFVCEPGRTIPEPQRVQLSKEQLPHYFKDDGPHPLFGVEIVVAGSAGDGYVRHMEKWGAIVLLTGEVDPFAALKKILNGEALPETRFDITTTLCKLRDLFSTH